MKKLAILFTLSLIISSCYQPKYISTKSEIAEFKMKNEDATALYSMLYNLDKSNKVFEYKYKFFKNQPADSITLENQKKVERLERKQNEKRSSK